jgi:hypothetical protein
MIDKRGSEFFEGETSDCVWLVAAVSLFERETSDCVWLVAAVSSSKEKLATAIWRVAAVSLFGRETGDCDLACSGSESLRKRDWRLQFGLLRQ